MFTILRRQQAICQCQRAFTTSAIRPVNLQWEKNDTEALAEVLPAYPYGPTRWYKQSKQGLYGGLRIRFGNNVGPKFKVKTRRSWKPNIVTRKLWSKALNRHVQVRVSTRVLRTIDKLGGLDEYLLGEKEARIKELGETGWWLRWAIMQTPIIKKRFQRERLGLGLPKTKSETEIVEDAIAEDGQETVSAIGNTAVAADGSSIKPPGRRRFIKFRVGPHRHLVLTDQGWRRTRPHSFFIAKIKERIVQTRFPNYMKRRLTNCENALKARQSRAQYGVKALSDQEVHKLYLEAGMELKREFREKVHRIYLEEMAVKIRQRRLRQARIRAQKNEGVVDEMT